MIKGILIDPFNETVMNVTLVDTKLQTVYSLLGCHLINITNLQDGVDMVLDDEGLLKDKDSQAYFKFGLHSQPFAGKALVIGTNDEGDFSSLPKEVSIDKINNQVIFFKPSQETLDESTQMTFTSF